MTDEPNSSEADSGSASGIVPLGKRSAFVSHAAVDRDLVEALGILIEHVYSDIVSVWNSSDPSPSGGMQPGDPPYTRIHTQMTTADTLWVLATAVSVTRPWVYWETGYWKALRTDLERGPVILRVGIDQNAVLSPLSMYECFDGSTATGITSLLKKFGAQLGMKLTDEQLAGPVEKWLEVAAEYVPGEPPEDSPEGSALQPEQLDRLEGILARMEATPVQKQTASRSRVFDDLLDTWFGTDRNREHVTVRGLVEFWQLVGPMPESAYEILGFMDEGVLAVSLDDGENQITVHLDGRWVLSLRTDLTVPPWVRNMVRDIRARWIEGPRA